MLICIFLKISTDCSSSPPSHHMLPYTPYTLRFETQGMVKRTSEMFVVRCHVGEQVMAFDNAGLPVTRPKMCLKYLHRWSFPPTFPRRICFLKNMILTKLPRWCHMSDRHFGLILISVEILIETSGTSSLNIFRMSCSVDFLKCAHRKLIAIMAG